MKPGKRLCDGRNQSLVKNLVTPNRLVVIKERVSTMKVSIDVEPIVIASTASLPIDLNLKWTSLRKLTS